MSRKKNVDSCLPLPTYFLSTLLLKFRQSLQSCDPRSWAWLQCVPAAHALESVPASYSTAPALLQENLALPFTALAKNAYGSTHPKLLNHNLPEVESLHVRCTGGDEVWDCLPSPCTLQWGLSPSSSDKLWKPPTATCSVKFLSDHTHFPGCPSAPDSCPPLLPPYALYFPLI